MRSTHLHLRRSLLVDLDRCQPVSRSINIGQKDMMNVKTFDWRCFHKMIESIRNKRAELDDDYDADKRLHLNKLKTVQFMHAYTVIPLLNC